MFSRETFIARADDDGVAPHVARGDFAWVDPDEPANPGRLVAAWSDGPGSATLVRSMLLVDGRRVLRAQDDASPDIVLDADNETMIRGTVVFAGRGFKRTRGVAPGAQRA